MPACDRRARSARGRATSVSSATTARRWTSNGLKSAPKSRATSASRASSSSTKTWWYFRHSSPSHCTVSVSGATTRQRSARPRADEAVQDQAGLDRLAEADLVGEQPAHGVGGGRALGHVELVGEEPDAPAEERAEAVGLAQRGEVQRVEAEGEVLDGVDVPAARRSTRSDRGVGRPGVVGGERHEGRRVARPGAA